MLGSNALADLPSAPFGEPVHLEIESVNAVMVMQKVLPRTGQHIPVTGEAEKMSALESTNFMFWPGRTCTGGCFAMCATDVAPQTCEPCGS